MLIMCGGKIQPCVLELCFKFPKTMNILNVISIPRRPLRWTKYAWTLQITYLYLSQKSISFLIKI